MKKKIMTVNVMGTNYKVFTATPNDFEKLKTCDGYMMPEKKAIYLDVNNQKEHQRHVLTHELVHAFLYESGLDVETWANNEEIVDWIAIQLFKLEKTVSNSIKVLEKPKEEKTNG